jgi:hypothetical protein
MFCSVLFCSVLYSFLITLFLCIFKVKELRARQHALQDEVMHRFFTQIVGIMETQYATIFRVKQQHSALLKIRKTRRKNKLGKNSNPVEHQNPIPNEIDNENEKKTLNKLELQLNDVLLSVDDWMFYLQDIFSLNIAVLRRSLVHHLITEFIYPVLLEPLKSCFSVEEKEKSVRSANVQGTRTPREGSPDELIAALMYLIKVCEGKSEECKVGGCIWLKGATVTVFHRPALYCTVLYCSCVRLSV